MLGSSARAEEVMRFCSFRVEREGPVSFAGFRGLEGRKGGLEGGVPAAEEGFGLDLVVVVVVESKVVISSAVLAFL